MHGWLLAASVFLASTVESVEALTIVLAVGTTRGWRSTQWGVAAALATLATFVAALGPAITSIPLDPLRLVVGGLLLVFGLQWLRKAILRASGLKALHDEDGIYLAQRQHAIEAGAQRRGLITDWYAFTVAFKGVLLEGLEVAFIVVTFGANQGETWLAVVSAAAAVICVAAAGFAVHRPLSRVPENTLKFAVGVMLVSFGMFWGTTGAGATWPGGDGALVPIIVIAAATSVATVAMLRRQTRVVTA